MKLYIYISKFMILLISIFIYQYAFAMDGPLTNFDVILKNDSNADLHVALYGTTPDRLDCNANVMEIPNHGSLSIRCTAYGKNSQHTGILKLVSSDYGTIPVGYSHFNSISPYNKFWIVYSDYCSQNSAKLNAMNLKLACSSSNISIDNGNTATPSVLLFTFGEA